MNMPALILALAVTGAVLGVGLLLLGLAASAREARLRRRYEGERVHGADVPAGRPDLIAGLARGGERIDRALKNPGETRVLLAQAGWRDVAARTRFYAFQLLLPVVVGVVGLLLFGASELLGDSALAPLLLLIAIILAVLAPRYILRARAKNRREAISREVSLFINVLVLLFESGLNLRQALSSLVRDGDETLPNIVDELRPVLRQIEAGADADDLLFETGKLLAIEELETALGILRQVERYGGEIREPLLETLDILQSKRSMALREQVNVMSGKMTVVLVTCFFPPLLIFIAGPAFMSISAALGNL